MKIGLMTDSVSALSTTETLDFAAELGVDTVEFATGNWSDSPHVDLDHLVADEAARTALAAAVADRGLAVSALTANGNSLHPTDGARQDHVVRETIRLAGLLGVSTVVMMSGLPAAPGDRHPNWITTSWPPETTAILEAQWEIALAYWRELAPFAADHGVRLALEMHGNQLVYSVPTLLRLREAVGPTVGANMDPSHLMWMGADPIRAVEALGEAGAVHYVHAKDTKLQTDRLALTSRLDTLPIDRFADRSWNYVTLGDGHPGGRDFWARFVTALEAAGYDGPLSIEHEDEACSPTEGVRRSVELLRAVLPARVG